MTKRLLLIGILSASALLGACKKKDATTGAGSGSDTGSGSAMMGSSMAGSGSAMMGSGSADSGSAMAGSGSAMAGSGSAMAAGSGSAMAAGALADNAAYTAKADAMTAKMMAVAKETDCGKLGAALSAEIDADKPDMEAIEAYEKAHPDDKKAYHHAHKDERKKGMENVMKCKDDPAVKAAMAKMH